MNRDIIVFGEDWGGLPSSTQHLIHSLSKDRKIFWINSIGLRQPKFCWKDIKRVFNKLFAKNNASKTIQKNHKCLERNFQILNPKTIPAPKTRVVRWLAAKLLVKQIKPAIKEAQLTKPILWTSLPTAVDIAGEFDEHALVYYCGDDFSALAGVDHTTVTDREKELVKKADLIIAASDVLVQRLSSPRTRLLQHGVNYSLFTKPCSRANDLPNDGRPIAGFYGSISEWLDLDLLAETIQRLPHWNFVFIGNTVVDTNQISCFDNVTFLGPIAHHLLPTYSQHWTASILPFHINAQIMACNPLKLKEYLAAGRPVITTEFPAINQYKGLVQIANNADAMVQALQASTHLETLPFFSETLNETVSSHSWEAKSEKLSYWLESL